MHVIFYYLNIYKKCKQIHLCDVNRFRAGSVDGNIIPKVSRESNNIYPGEWPAFRLTSRDFDGAGKLHKSSRRRARKKEPRHL